MTRKAVTLLTLAALSAAAAGGFWIGRHGLEPAAMVAPDPAMSSPLRAAGGPVIYYQDPDGKPLYSPEPKQTSDGRAWRAVHASEDVSFDEKVAVTTQPANRRILY
jgi:Cu(I)/Ag(I) efflux system membrane fusion protein